MLFEKPVKKQKYFFVKVGQRIQEIDTEADQKCKNNICNSFALIILFYEVHI